MDENGLPGNDLPFRWQTQGEVTPWNLWERSGFYASRKRNSQEQGLSPPLTLLDSLTK